MNQPDKDNLETVNSPAGSGGGVSGSCDVSQAHGMLRERDAIIRDLQTAMRVERPPSNSGEMKRYWTCGTCSRITRDANILDSRYICNRCLSALLDRQDEGQTAKASTRRNRTSRAASTPGTTESTDTPQDLQVDPKKGGAA